MKEIKIEQKKFVKYAFTISTMIRGALNELGFSNTRFEVDNPSEGDIKYLLECDYNGKHFKDYPCLIGMKDGLELGPGSCISFSLREDVEVETSESVQLNVTIVLDYPELFRHLLNQA